MDIIESKNEIFSIHNDGFLILERFFFVLAGLSAFRSAMAKHYKKFITSICNQTKSLYEIPFTKN